MKYLPFQNTNKIYLDLFRVVHIVTEVIAEIEIVDDVIEAHEMTKIRAAVALTNVQAPMLKQENP